MRERECLSCKRLGEERTRKRGDERRTSGTQHVCAMNRNESQ